MHRKSTRQRTRFSAPEQVRSSLARCRGPGMPWVAASLLLLAACAPAEPPPAHTLSGNTMGTRYELRLADPPPDGAQLAAAVQAELAALNQALSTWQADSEISRFNALWPASAEAEATDGPAAESARPGGAWIRPGPHLRAVVQRAVQLHAATDGALDITLLPLARAWGFQGISPPRVPDQDTIDALRARSGMHLLLLSEDGQALRKLASGLELDLSALGKGYAVDRLALLLSDAGIENYSVEIGGEVRARGERPGGGPWRVGLAVPGVTTLKLALRDRAVATSGDYRNYFELDGRRYAHILDPATGRPAAYGVAAATVVAPDAMSADALATAFMSMAPERSLALAEALQVEILLVLREDDGHLRQLRSAAFPLLD